MIEVLKQALEALEYIDNNYMSLPKVGNEAIASLRQAIKELESQEPLGYIASMALNDMRDGIYGEVRVYHEELGGSVPIYTHPPQRTWVGLIEEELRVAFGKLYPNDIGILELAENNRDYAVEAIGARHHWTAFKAGARAIEAAHGIKE